MSAVGFFGLHFLAGPKLTGISDDYQLAFVQPGKHLDVHAAFLPKLDVALFH